MNEIDQLVGTMLGDGHTENLKKKFSSFRDFSGKKLIVLCCELRTYYKATIFFLNRWIHFVRNLNVYFFLMWISLNFNSKSKMKKEREWRYLQGALDIEIGRDWSVGLGALLGDGHAEKFFFFSFRDSFREKPKVPRYWVSNVL